MADTFFLSGGATGNILKREKKESLLYFFLNEQVRKKSLKTILEAPKKYAASSIFL